MIFYSFFILPIDTRLFRLNSAMPQSLLNNYSLLAITAINHRNNAHSENIHRSPAHYGHNTALRRTGGCKMCQLGRVVGGALSVRIRSTRKGPITVRSFSVAFLYRVDLEARSCSAFLSSRRRTPGERPISITHIVGLLPPWREGGIDLCLRLTLQPTGSIRHFQAHLQQM